MVIECPINKDAESPKFKSEKVKKSDNWLAFLELAYYYFKKVKVEDKMKISKCDICGKVLDEFDLQENFGLHYNNIGYGSKFDGEKINIDMCCGCFDKMMIEYIIPKINKGGT